MKEEYDVLEYPKSRVATFDVGQIGGKKHQITGLLEIDVTDAKKKIRGFIRDDREIGFIAWMIRVVAGTVAEAPSVQAINTGRTRQIVFKDVDVSFPIERLIKGQRVPLAALIKSANNKSVEEIHREITVMRGQNIESENDYVLGKSSSGVSNRLFFNMPQWVRMLIWKNLLGNPFVRKKSMGTVIITNVGLTGSVAGWIVPRTIHNMGIGLGSINKRPWVVNNEIVIREIMHLTVLFDHDVVDGAPAAKFASRLVRNIEKAQWLE